MLTDKRLKALTDKKLKIMKILLGLLIITCGGLIGTYATENWERSTVYLTDYMATTFSQLVVRSN